MPITEDNVLDVATDAMEYESTFQSDAQTILIACAKFLQPKFADGFAVVQFVADNGDSIATVHRLAVIIKDLPALKCTNCGKDTCQHGSGIEETQFRVGLKVGYNPAAQVQDCWGKEITYFTGEIKGLPRDNAVLVKYVYKLSTETAARNETNNYPMRANNGLCTFIFNCK